MEKPLGRASERLKKRPHLRDWVTRILSAVLSPVIKWLVMKKDNELPWVTRIFRWVALVLGTVFASGYTVHCYFEWFLQ